MTTRRGAVSRRCKVCKINYKLCFCNDVYKVENQNHVSIIMHKAERFLPSNTVNLLKLGLENIDVTIRGGLGFKLEDEFQFIEGATSIYLFPSEDAEVLSQESLERLGAKKIQLIVPDGTWRQAKKIHRREKLLADIPCFKLETGSPSIYELRTQISEHGLSTAEAVAHAMGVIEGEDVKEKLLKNVEIMNERVMISRHSYPN